MATRQLLQLAIAFVALVISTETSEASKKLPPPPRFPFKIDPETPLKDLLPTPPDIAVKLPSVLNEDLSFVPELMFAKPLARDLEFFKSQEVTAHVMAKINHLNQKSEDGFMKKYLAQRDDLRGLPFLLGKECRTQAKRAQVFAAVAQTIQLYLAESERGDSTGPEQKLVTHQEAADKFWAMIAKQVIGVRIISPGSDPLPAIEKTEQESVSVAALSQMIAPLPVPYRVGMAKHLSAVKHADAGRALARLAIFSSEDAVRSAAVEGLKNRPAREYIDTLLTGFQYPLPVLSKRAAEALIKTQAKDALTRLADVLEQPDPRAPAKKTVAGKEVSFVRELVRVNHHHNCLLCHAPANTDDVPKDVLSAPAPQPSQPLPSPFRGYGSRMSPDTFVRIDMTYLRQDFSMMMKVEDAKPWPEMQRYDFFVRERIVTPAQAAEYAKELEKRTPPNHAAAQVALRELTGEAPKNGTAQEWRSLLKLP